MIKKTFVTIFDRTKNFHLVKDVGQIPFHMYKEFDYDSKIVTCKNDSEYPYLDKEVKGLKIDFISKINFFNINLGVVFYLIKNSKNIEILHQFHIRSYTLFYAKLYKMLNKNGINYIKADANEKYLMDRGTIIKKKHLKNVDKYVDFISFETEEIAKLVRENYITLAKKVLRITNGIDENYVKSLNLKVMDCSEKENIILYVARVGSFQKNTELFLSAIEKIDLDDWKVHIIGEIDKKFEFFVKSFISNNSNLKNKVIFHGNITSREEIYNYYSRAKIFCLTSLYEGFPLVFPEALYFGNYIITTDVSGAKDITNNEKFGTIVKDFEVETYSSSLQQLIKSLKLDNKYCENIKNFALENFTWQSIVKNLHEKLNSKND